MTPQLFTPRGFEIGVGFGAGGERKRAVNDGAEAPLGNEIQDGGELGLCTHIRAEQRKLPAEKKTQVDPGVVAGGIAAGDEAPAVPERKGVEF